MRSGLRNKAHFPAFPHHLTAFPHQNEYSASTNESKRGHRRDIELTMNSW